MRVGLAAFAKSCSAIVTVAGFAVEVETRWPEAVQFLRSQASLRGQQVQPISLLAAQIATILADHRRRQQSLKLLIGENRSRSRVRVVALELGHVLQRVRWPAVVASHPSCPCPHCFAIAVAGDDSEVVLLGKFRDCFGDGDALDMRVLFELRLLDHTLDPHFDGRHLLG